jgi:hypothetical protein
MSMNQTDLDQLSRRFVDLWQEQWLHLVSSPETAASMGKMMEMMAPAQQMMGKFFAPETASREPNKAPPHTPAAEAPPAASGAASLAAAFEPVARQLALLAHRLDALDARFDALESPARPARKPRAKPAAAKPRATRAKPQPSRRKKSRSTR